MNRIVSMPKVSMKINWKQPLDQYLKDRVGAKPVSAELVEPGNVKCPSVYKRFLDPDKKAAFRLKLIETISKGRTPQQVARFLALAENLDKNGAVIFGAIIKSQDFEKLIGAYTKILEESGSKSWLHSYVNLANHPDFLTNTEFNAAFTHPLLIALVSYKMGGAVRVVDARGKDAEPIKVLAQDNMLHIDNSPFGDEYKVILAWERGKPSGPKGQNFVFLPGTQKGARQCMMSERGPWSSENASIFITPESIEKVLLFQEKMIGKTAVVELTHPTKPLTTLFSAGSLVHHRHRTEGGSARSCMIIAFHRAQDNPGQLVDPSHLKSTDSKIDRLSKLLFSQDGDRTEDQFLAALGENMDKMNALLTEIDALHGEAKEIVPNTRELEPKDIAEWKETCTEAPTVELTKETLNIVSIGQDFTKDEFLEHVGRMMAYDKHGPLDLILYPDAHEEIRKWARNKIREKNGEALNSQFKTGWSEVIKQPEESDLLTAQALQAITYELAEKAITCKKINGETISEVDATRSVRQLLLDLGEAIVRCENKAAFLSTSLFIFWATDMISENAKEIEALGARLLQHYLATAILVATTAPSE